MNRLFSIALIGTVLFAATASAGRKKKAEVVGSCKLNCKSGQRTLQIVKMGNNKLFLQDIVKGMNINLGDGVPLEKVLDTKKHAVAKTPWIQIFKTAYPNIQELPKEMKGKNPSEFTGPTFNNSAEQDSDEMGVNPMVGPPLQREYFGVIDNKLFPFKYSGNFHPNGKFPDRNSYLAINKNKNTILDSPSRVFVIRKGKEDTQPIVHRLLQSTNR